MKLSVTGRTIYLIEDDTLVERSKKTYSVQFLFSRRWDGLEKTAVFQAGSMIREVPITEDRCVIPAECLAHGGVKLLLRVRGEATGEPVAETSRQLLSRILYDPAIDLPPGPHPAPGGDIERLCEEFAEVLGTYPEAVYQDKTLTDVIYVVEDDIGITATDQEVEDVIEDVFD